MLDLPGIIEGASQGKGRGKQVIAVARTADCVAMQLEAHKAEYQRINLTKELESVGIRLNQVMLYKIPDWVLSPISLIRSKTAKQ